MLQLRKAQWQGSCPPPSTPTELWVEAVFGVAATKSLMGRMLPNTLPLSTGADDSLSVDTGAGDGERDRGTGG